MDEENSKIKDTVKAGIEKQGKDKARKIIKNVIIKGAPFILYLIIGILVAVFLSTAFAYLLDLIKGESSKNANTYAVIYSSSITADSSDNKIIVDIDNISSSGSYNLSYEFKDEDGNVLTESESIEKIKADLLEKNNKLNLDDFSDSELKIIGALMYNGLQVDAYSEDELRALVIFVKADIASQSFDFRSLDEIGKEITLNDVVNSDEVYGTLQVHRTKLEDDGNGGVVSNEVTLEYISYGDETTLGTFCYLVAQNDESVIDKFSINEDGDLVIAKWSETSITYQYLDKDGNGLSEKDKAQIAEEYIGENTLSETYITASTPINYKQYITKYAASYGLLSDLLITTQNVDFCLELAKLAFNSKIVINVKEELTTTNTTETTNYIQTKLIYDYVEYEIYEQNESTTSSWETVTSGYGNPEDNTELSTTYEWVSSCPYTETGENGRTYVYEWNHSSGTKYQLKYINISSYQYWTLYNWVEKTLNTNVLKETNENEEGDLINVDNNHIKEEYDEYAIDEDYTDEEVFEYTIVKTTQSKTNTYDFEISEIDTWYAKYTSQYNTPSITLNSSSGAIDSNEGEYSKEQEQVLNTTNSDEINADEHVSEFITQKKGEYSSAENIQCNVTELTVKQRVKTDIQGEYASSTTKYEFGENVADTTEVDFKNIEYVNNEKSFTEEDEDGNSEIGFLYIYNKYIEYGVDLFLQDDAEQQLFELLESDTKTSAASDIIKYFLYVYDGVDRGVTSLSLKIVDLNSFNGVKGSSTENYIKAWENDALWSYETGRSSVFPSLYLTEDESCYIVYEDGSNGHNNIAYGVATFTNCSEDKSNAVYRDDYEWGYYNWAEGFASEGIMVENLYEGAYVNKQIADSIFVNMVLPTFVIYVEDYLETNLPEYEFSQAQIDALVSISYNCGNINGFAKAYKNSLNDDGSINADLLKINYERFNYSGTVNDRNYANWLLFTQEIYIDRNGNEIELGSGSLLESAYEVADHFMYSGVEVHYAGNSVEGSTNNGRFCVFGDIQGSWDLPIEQPEKYGVVCATFVSLSIWKAGLIDEDTINSYAYNSVLGVEDMLMNSQYSDEWEIIKSFDELQEGDIVSTNGHIFIYVEDGKCLDQAYCVIRANGTDGRGGLSNASYYKTEFRYGFRYIGK